MLTAVVRAILALTIGSLVLLLITTVRTRRLDVLQSLRSAAVGHEGSPETSANAEQDSLEGQDAKVAAKDNTAELLFSEIYDKKSWSHLGGGSGAGSTKAATVVTQAIVRTVANKYDLHSLLDAPCGAMEWQPLLLKELAEDFKDFRYLGVDVVPAIIQANQAKFENQTNWKFMTRDLLQHKLPTGYDLVLSRDALQHMPCEKAVQALKTLAFSGARNFLLGSYEHETSNWNIVMGDYFDINLRLPPFELEGGILRSFSEHTSKLAAEEHPSHDNQLYPDKYLLLFAGKYLRSRDFSAMSKKCAELSSKPRAQKL